MVDKIIELLPSNDLKAEIHRTDYKFTDGQLLQIIYKYAPTFDERIGLMEDFAKQAEPDIAELAALFVADQKELLRKFKENDGSFVYELNIKDTPDSYCERYICASFEAALKCIDGYYEHYSFAQETDQTICRVVKRKIFGVNSEFDDDNYAQCNLRAKKVIVSVRDNKRYGDCNLDKTCDACDQICIYRQDALTFPCFIKHLDIVRYQTTYSNDGFGLKDCFAACLFPETCCFDDCDLYAIKLDSYAITQHKFDEIHNCHSHPELPVCDVVSPESLDEETRENYFAFVEYSKTHDIWQ